VVVGFCNRAERPVSAHCALGSEPIRLTKQKPVSTRVWEGIDQ